MEYDILVDLFYGPPKTPEQIAREEILRILTFEFSLVRFGFPNRVRYYNTELAFELKAKMVDIVIERFHNRSSSEIARDKQFNNDNEQVYLQIAHKWFNDEQHQTYKQAEERAFKRTELLQDYRVRFKDEFVSQVNRLGWDRIVKSYNIHYIVDSYLKYRSDGELSYESNIELQKEDYLAAAYQAIFDAADEIKKLSRTRIYKRYSNMVKEILNDDNARKMTPYESDRYEDFKNLEGHWFKLPDFAGKGLHFYRSVYNLIEDANIEEKEADKMEWVTEGDYFRWCQVVWEDRDWENQRRRENEEWKNQQAYDDYQATINPKYDVYGGPSDGYGGYLDDDYIDDALGGDPDAYNID